jgi:hypothetical protein
VDGRVKPGHDVERGEGHQSFLPLPAEGFYLFKKVLSYLDILVELRHAARFY